MRNINTIYIHYSASSWGNAKEIDRWHKARGWRCIGYHFVILNGYPTSMGDFVPDLDGAIERGRPISEIGAHVANQNANSIGICMIGGAVTPAQRATALKLCKELMDEYPTIDRILGHKEAPGAATECPGSFDMNAFRRDLRDETKAEVEYLESKIVITIPRR
jgi:N-acetylmuramoyl-L-alanine amidase